MDKTYMGMIMSIIDLCVGILGFLKSMYIIMTFFNNFGKTLFYKKV